MNRQSFLAVFAVPVLILASCSGKYDFVQKPVEGEGARGGLLTLGVGENGGSLNVQSLGDTYSEIVFTADEKWEVRGPEGYEDWIELEKVSGADLGSVGTSTIRVTVRPNLSGDSRSANLEFIGENTRKALATLTVSQDAIIFRLSDDTQTQLEDNRVNMSFKWSEFILKDGEERSKDQPFARSFTLESNVEYEIEGQEDAEKVFDFHITGEGQARTITIVPKEPCMADAGIDMEWQRIPRANFNALVSPWYGKPVADHLKLKYAQPYHWFHRPPIGANQTEEWLNQVLEFALNAGADIDVEAAGAFIRHEVDSYYEEIDSLASFLLEFRYGLPNHVHILHDAG